MRICHFASLAAALSLSAATPATAQQPATQVGRLSCDVSAGLGMILEQKQTMRCMFIPSNGAPPEPYLVNGTTITFCEMSEWCSSRCTGG